MDNTQEDRIVEWVLGFTDDPKPSHARFSATEVAHLIVKYMDTEKERKLDGFIEKAFGWMMGHVRLIGSSMELKGKFRKYMQGGDI